MKNRIIEYIKIGILIGIFVVMLIINHNLRIFGHRIMSLSKQTEQINAPQKIELSKSKGVFVGDIPPCLTITAYIDYECVFCKRFMDEVFPLIRTNYINTGKVSIEFRNLPLEMHEHSLFAAKSAICANKYDRFLDLSLELFKNQSSLSDSTILRLISKMNIDKNQFQVCMADSATENKINFDIRECRKNEIKGTPTFVINGNVYVGLIPYDGFKTIIEKELAKNPQHNTCH